MCSDLYQLRSSGWLGCNPNRNPNHNPKEVKRIFFYSNVCLKCILKWKIFSGAGDRLEQKHYSYVESYNYVEVYDAWWNLLKCSSISCAGDRIARKCLNIYDCRIMYNRIILCRLYWCAVVYFVTGVVGTKLSGLRYSVTWIGYPDR